MNHVLEQTIRTVVNTTHGWSPFEKCTQLAEWIIAEKIELAVELGIFGGRSVIPMAMAMRENKSGVVWGIDPWTVAASIEEETDQKGADWWRNTDHEVVYQSFVLNLYRHGLIPWCNWIRAKAEDAVHFFRDESIGLLHQDANHTEKVSCRQVIMWKDKVKPGGIWVMDDIHWKTQNKALELIGDFTDPIGEWEFEGQQYAAFRVRARPTVEPVPPQKPQKPTKKKGRVVLQEA